MHPTREKFFEIVESIENGEMDQYLRDINSACAARQRRIHTEKAEVARAEITVGSRVYLKGIKPRYMEGAWATVVKINQTRAVINLDHERGKWRGDITVPLSCLVSLDRQKEAVS